MWTPGEKAYIIAVETKVETLKKRKIGGEKGLKSDETKQERWLRNKYV